MPSLRFALVLVATGVAVGDLVAQANPVYRANRTFYTSMWTANPPEYTTAGQTVAAGTMHWRAFLDQANLRREPRRINGIGTWWQPSDPNGTFPQTIDSLEFRMYPTTRDAGGLVVPDVAQQPMLTVPAMPMPVMTGGNFKSVTIALGNPVNVSTTADFAICGVYPAGANSTTPGFFGMLPSASNQSYGLSQSYFGFAYPNGTITHFGIGGARSAIWYTEEQPTLNARANWAISDGHNSSGYLSGAFGDATYFSPLADAGWAGWADSRNPATLALTVQAGGRNGDLAVLLLNFGLRFPGGVPFLGQTLELSLVDPELGTLLPASGPIMNGRHAIDIPLLTSPFAPLAGTELGIEAVLFDTQNAQLSGTTQSVWIVN